MARRKKPNNRKPQRPDQPAKPAPMPSVPDRRSLEATLSQFAQGTADTPARQAQQVVYQAFAEHSPSRRVQLAREALVISPDCADAHVLLGEHESNRKAALVHYQNAVAAGERAIGPKQFAEWTGHFWGVLDTRGYVRARASLAATLWQLGRRDEALAHHRELLRLNPNDNLGLRYVHAGWLLFLGRDEELGQLLDRYDQEGTASWLYNRAIHAFRQHGDTIETRRMLKAARKANEFVPDYLTGRQVPPEDQPASYTRGEESEALIYVSNALPGWRFTPGAVAWMRANDGRRKPEPPVTKGPLGVIKKWMTSHLPQTEDVWQADYRPMPNWVRGESSPIRPWIILVCNMTSDLVLAHTIVEPEPTPELLWDLVLQAAQHPKAGSPGRPAELQVPTNPLWLALQPHFAEVGIQLTTPAQLDYTDAVFAGLIAHLGAPAPGLLEMGISPEQVAGLYDAAAIYFLAMPWKKSADRSSIRIESTVIPGGSRIGFVMGASGLTLGLALYQSMDHLRQMWSPIWEPEDVGELSSIGLTFGEAWSIPPSDLDAANAHGWRVARPDAYPSLMCAEVGQRLRPPLPSEVQIVEACLRAIPVFVERRTVDDPTKEKVTVATTLGEVTLTLAWQDEDAK